MWNIKSANGFRTAAKFFEKFLAYCSGGLAEVQALIHKTVTYRLPPKPAKKKTYGPVVMVLEDRVVPAGWPLGPTGVELVTCLSAAMLSSPT